MTSKSRGKVPLIPEYLDTYSRALQAVIQDIAESLNQLVLLRADLEKELEIIKKATR